MWALVGYTFVTISGFCVFSFLKESSVMMFLFCKEHYDYYYYLHNTKICPAYKYHFETTDIQSNGKHFPLKQQPKTIL